MIRLAAAALGTGAPQALVAQATFKAFDEAVLLRLTRLDAMPLVPGDLALRKNGVTGHLGANVADCHARQPATPGSSAHFADDTSA